MSDKAKRNRDLLLKAAKALGEGCDPFSHGWLSENEVTLDECYDLSEAISVIVKGSLALRQEERMKLLALGAVYGEPGIDIEVFRSSIELSQTTKKLADLNKGRK